MARLKATDQLTACKLAAEKLHWCRPGCRAPFPRPTEGTPAGHVGSYLVLNVRMQVFVADVFGLSSQPLTQAAAGTRLGFTSTVLTEGRLPVAQAKLVLCPLTRR